MKAPISGQLVSQQAHARILILCLILVSTAMSSATVLESEATFQMQAQRAGLSQSYIDCIKAAPLGTLGKLAYALTTPGTAPTELQVNNFLNAMRPAVAPTVADTTAMKRIVFEAQTLTIANLRNSMVASDDSTSKKVAPAERSARIEGQRARLRGLDLSGRFQRPSERAPFSNEGGFTFSEAPFEGTLHEGLKGSSPSEGFKGT